MHRSPARPKSSLLLALRAAQLRSAPTESEARLWSALNARKLGVTFRRQLPVGGFIADFAAPAARLIVEVDGSSHRGRAACDARRDRKLARLGYRVLRIDAALVMADLDAAVERVQRALDECA